MGNNLRRLRIKKAWTIVETARRMNMSKGGYEKLERAERQLTSETLARAAKVFGVTQGDIADDASPVPVVGYVGAGSQAYYTEGDGDLGEAPRPPGFSPSGVALKVSGDSMPGVAEDGWLIFYEDRRDPPTEDMHGELCVVGLDNGDVHLKRIYSGSQPGTFDLISTSPHYTPMRNRRVVWAAKVEWIKPR